MGADARSIKLVHSEHTAPTTATLCLELDSSKLICETVVGCISRWSEFILEAMGQPKTPLPPQRNTFSLGLTPSCIFHKSSVRETDSLAQLIVTPMQPDASTRARVSAAAWSRIVPECWEDSHISTISHSDVDAAQKPISANKTCSCGTCPADSIRMGANLEVRLTSPICASIGGAGLQSLTHLSPNLPYVDIHLSLRTSGNGLSATSRAYASQINTILRLSRTKKGIVNDLSRVIKLTNPLPQTRCYPIKAGAAALPKPVATRIQDRQITLQRRPSNGGVAPRTVDTALPPKQASIAAKDQFVILHASAHLFDTDQGLRCLPPRCLTDFGGAAISAVRAQLHSLLMSLVDLLQSSELSPVLDQEQARSKWATPKETVGMPQNRGILRKPPRASSATAENRNRVSVKCAVEPPPPRASSAQPHHRAGHWLLRRLPRALRQRLAAYSMLQHVAKPLNVSPDAVIVSILTQRLERSIRALTKRCGFALPSEEVGQVQKYYGAIALKLVSHTRALVQTHTNRLQQLFK